MTENAQTLLGVQGLTVDFDAGKSTEIRALEQVNLSISEGETVGLVGESGSGKTVLTHSIIGLLPNNGTVSSGRIEWGKRNLIEMSERELRRIRGKEIAMIFQDPQASLNPVYTVGKQVEWVLKMHRDITGANAKTEILRLFESVKLRDPTRCARAYPHELSGGMCQRVMIAMALAAHPRLLIADEPTSALDVSIAAEIVSLLSNLHRTLGLSILVITHDLSVATRLADRIAVLDRGQLVEELPAAQFLSQARHAASRRLIDASRFMGGSLQQITVLSDFSLTE
jgi:ABC-type dipeptide/oligopeptide/nickel transport system ATPase component